MAKKKIKRAYVDMQIEGMNYIMKLYGSDGPKSDLLKRIEMMEDGSIRLHLEGDLLPDTFDETPQKAEIYYESVISMGLPWKGTTTCCADSDWNKYHKAH